MIKALSLITAVCAMACSAAAQLQFEGVNPEDMTLREYFAAENQNYNKSIIYIFYNGNECYQCPQTIALTEQIYNQYYAGRYSMFVIDYANDDEYNFIQAYHLNEPLAIVLVRIEDGQSVGWHKISNPQNMIEAPEDYTQYLTEEINNYLGYAE